MPSGGRDGRVGGAPGAGAHLASVRPRNEEPGSVAHESCEVSSSLGDPCFLWEEQWLSLIRCVTAFASLGSAP